MKIRAAITNAVVAASLTLAGAQPVWAAGFDANALMLLLGSQPPGKASFVETKTLAMLKKPIVSEGEVRFEPPGKLIMITRSPKAMSIVVDGDTVLRKEDGRSGRIKLDDYPEIAGLIEGIRGSLGGNRMLLEQYFNLDVTGSASAWRMQLTPKDSRVSRFIRHIDVSGKQHVIHAVDVLQTDGDSSHMALTPLP